MNLALACDALKSGLRVQFTYSNALRIVEVHSAGYSKDNRPVILGWQVSGGSKSGNPSPWRNFYLDEVSNGVVLDEKSQAPRQGYAGGGRAIDRIVAEL